MFLFIYNRLILFIGDVGSLTHFLYRDYLTKFL